MGTLRGGADLGAEGEAVGEVCFHTAMTGYQEVMTDPSFAGQIITFTFPHIGNVGANPEDIEANDPHALGIIVREDVTAPSNFRSVERLDDWMKRHDRIGLSGIDTRALTRAHPHRRRAQWRDLAPGGRQVRHPAAAGDGQGLAGAGGHGPRHLGHHRDALWLGGRHLAAGVRIRGHGFGRMTIGRMSWRSIMAPSETSTAIW